MKRTMLTGWNLWRILRLVFGLIIISQGIRTSDWLFIAAGAFLSGTALLNIGCCCDSACDTRLSKTNQDKSEKVEYEEVL